MPESAARHPRIFSSDQRSLDRIFLFFRCDLDYCCIVEVEPGFVEAGTLSGIGMIRRFRITLVYLCCWPVLWHARGI